MKIFTSEQVRLIDAYTIKNEPISSINLMERAAKSFLKWFVMNFDKSTEIFVFAGPGNNGGDALAVSRMLFDMDYRLTVFAIKFNSKMSEDCRINYDRLRVLKGLKLHDIGENDLIPEIKTGSVIIDGLFGSGLTRPVTGFPGRIIECINSASSKVVSIDIPSGLFGEDNRSNVQGAIVKADFTVTFQFPFLSFFFAENYQYTGEWIVVDIGLSKVIIDQLETDNFYIHPGCISKKIKRRSKFSHKGSFGHALLISGSHGMMGAAVLSAKACLRGGAGLLTVHVPSCGYQIIQTAAPEALVSTDSCASFVSNLPDLSKYDAVGIGPGLSLWADQENVLHKLLLTIKVPLVMDADAINILSSNKKWYEKLPSNTILTPHPGEFDRLAGNSDSMFERYVKQLEFARKYNVIVVLKGAHTIVAMPDGSSFFNTTGNPGMASGGTGDILTGLILSLLAQSYKPSDAALIAVYLHGMAADLAVRKTGQEAMIAGDIIDNIGPAFLSLDQ